MADINEQAIRETATRYVDELFREMEMLDADGDRHIVEFTDEEMEQAFVDGMSAASAEHPNATDWQNRSERAEAECAELRERLEVSETGYDGIAARDETIRLLERKIDALQQHAEAMAEALGAVMIGGNHIALLIGADHPPASTECEYALEHYGAGDQYDAWCCWRSIMLARKPLANWTAWLIDGKD